MKHLKVETIFFNTIFENGILKGINYLEHYDRSANRDILTYEHHFHWNDGIFFGKLIVVTTEWLSNEKAIFIQNELERKFSELTSIEANVLLQEVKVKGRR